MLGGKRGHGGMRFLCFLSSSQFPDFWASRGSCINAGAAIFCDPHLIHSFLGAERRRGECLPGPRFLICGLQLQPCVLELLQLPDCFPYQLQQHNWGSILQCSRSHPWRLGLESVPSVSSHFVNTESPVLHPLGLTVPKAGSVYELKAGNEGFDSNAYFNLL